MGRHFVQQSSSSLEFYHHNSSSAGHSSRSDSGGVGFSREQDQGLHYKYGPLVEYVSQRSEGFPRQQHNWYSQQQHHFQSFEPAAGGNGKRARSWSRSRSADVATNRNQRPRERSGDRRDESGGFASPEPRNQSRFSN